MGHSLSAAYPFFFHKEEEGGYFIESPDIQGVYTGINEDDIAEGLKMAEEVLGMTLADMIEKGEMIPEPSDIRTLVCEDGFVTMVAVEVTKFLREGESVKKTLTIPKWANDLGNRKGVNFSKVLTEALSRLAIGKIS